MPRRTTLTHFRPRAGELWCEGVALTAIAKAVGTPVYVYSRAQLLRNYRALANAPGAPSLICYAVKALSNLAVLKLLADEGSGFDVVSGGELARVMAAGGDPAKVVFSGVAKSEDELAEALGLGIRCFNVEGEEELELLSEVAVRLGKTAPTSLRVNPHVDAKTHPYIATALRESKFGIPISRARAVYRRAANLPGLHVKGLDFHLGSQITSLGPFREALAEIGALWDALIRDGHTLEHLDVGGGLGIRYQNKNPPSPQAWLALLRRCLGGRQLQLLIEPGRAIAADAGVLLTRVLGHKRGQARRFLLVDAGMNDLLRPALYDAYHAILPVTQTRGRSELLDVVGPVCESADFLARRRRLVPPERGGLLAVMDAGAYGFTMGSSYNSRLRPAEVLVDGDRFEVIREREARADLWRGERLPKG